MAVQRQQATTTGQKDTIIEHINPIHRSQDVTPEPPRSDPVATTILVEPVRDKS